MPDYGLSFEQYFDLVAPSKIPKVYSAKATVLGGTKINTTQNWADLPLEGGDGLGITIPDPGGVGAELKVEFSMSFLVTAACGVGIKIYVDGIFVTGGSMTTPSTFGFPDAGSMGAITGSVHLTPGNTHAIKVQWRANVGNISIDPTSPDITQNAPYHATLIATVTPT